MNERIKQLAEQAEKYASEKDGKYDGAGNLNWQWQDINMEKFAELIVQECARVASDRVMDVEGNDWGVRWAIKNHFGVEQ
jgi:hypothetical protein